MLLGQRLKQARLDAGLSQRQLCGQEITRNMLSQIEHGTARPSMTTLQYLAGQLGKPISFFLEEQTVTSPNQQLMERARQGSGEQVLELLEQYQAPDPVFDRERYLLEAQTCMELAERALDRQMPGYARSLLEQAAAAGDRTPYFTDGLRRQLLVLQYRAEPERAAELAAGLPADDGYGMLLAHSALQKGDPEGCGRLLDAMPREDSGWQYLRGEAYFAEKQYRPAADCYRKAEPQVPKLVCSRLEICYRELGDYRMAYLYACRQRELT